MISEFQKQHRGGGGGGCEKGPFPMTDDVLWFPWCFTLSLSPCFFGAHSFRGCNGALVSPHTHAQWHTIGKIRRKKLPTDGKNIVNTENTHTARWKERERVAAAARKWGEPSVTHSSSRVDPGTARLFHSLSPVFLEHTVRGAHSLAAGQTGAIKMESTKVCAQSIT